MRVITALAWAGLRHHPLRWVLLALGVAAGAVLPVVAAGLREGATVAAVRSALNSLPAGQQAVFAYDGTNADAAGLSARDTAVRAEWQQTGLPDPDRYLFFRQLSVAGSTFTLGATDSALTGPDAPVRLTSGRLPTTCTPTRCEVVLAVPATLAGLGLSVASITPGASQLGLVVTGTAELTDARLAGGHLIDGTQPVLLGGSVARLAVLDSLSLFGRTVSWVGDLPGDLVAGVGADAFAVRIQAMTQDLTAEFGALTIDWPQDAAVSAEQRAARSAQRFTVLGAGAAVLQLGFALVAATGLRRRQQFVVRLLTRRGATRVQLALTPLTQVVAVVLAGTLVGLGVGAAVVALTLGHDPGGRAAAVGRAIAAATPTLVGFALGAAVVTLAVALWPERAGRATRLVLDALLVAAVGLAVLVLADASTAGGDAAGPLDLSVTTIIAVTAGLVAARCWPLLAGFVGRRRRWPANAGRAGLLWRLAVLGGQRRALVPAVAAAFLASAVTSVVFATTYRATLADSAQQQASFQVPLDLRVSSSPDVPTPLSVLDSAAIEKIGPGVTIAPVVASSVTAFPGARNVAAFPLIGLDPSVLPQLHDFAATTGGDLPAAELATRISSNLPTGSPPAPRIPAEVNTLDIPATGLTTDADLSLWVTTDDGAEHQLPLVPAGAGLRTHVQLGQAARVVAVEITESAGHLMHRQHATGEGNTDHAYATGSLQLGRPVGDGTPLDWTWAGWGADHVTVTPTAGILTANYALSGDRAVIVPAFVARTNLGTLPVAADPTTAAQAIDGALTVSVSGLVLTAKVVAVLPRMPTFGDRFLLADRTTVAALLDRTEPGTAAVNQVWIGAPSALVPAVQAEVTGGPAAAATVQVRTEIAATLAHDPVATRSATLLAVAGLLAALLALGAVAVSVRVDRQDSAADQLSFEVDGLPPGSLRRVLVGRAAVVVALGVPLGAVAGVLVTSAAVRLIQVGAAGVSVEPPVQADLGGWWTVALAAGLAVVGLLAAAGAAAGSFRERYPVIPDADLR